MLCSFFKSDFPEKVGSVKSEIQNSYTLPIDGTEKETKPSSKKNTGVSIMVFGRKIAIKLPKNDLDTRFILSSFCEEGIISFGLIVISVTRA